MVGGNRPEDASAGRRPESTKTPEKEDGEKPPPPRAGSGEQCSLPPGRHVMITSCVILILIAYNKH